jgi:hypothetical protein
MADIPVRPRRRTTPSWVWLVVGVVVLLIILALIDYFVTNIVFTRGATTSPGRADDPFGAHLGAALIVLPAFMSSLTRRL